LEGRYDHDLRMAELSVANLDVRALAAQTHPDGPCPSRRPHPALYGLMAAFVGAALVATVFLAMGATKVGAQLDTRAPSSSVDRCDRSHPNCAP
jgi:hypothetical protein